MFLRTMPITLQGGHTRNIRRSRDADQSLRKTCLLTQTARITHVGILQFSRVAHLLHGICVIVTFRTPKSDAIVTGTYTASGKTKPIDVEGFYIEDYFLSTVTEYTLLTQSLRTKHFISEQRYSFLFFTNYLLFIVFHLLVYVHTDTH